MSITDFCSFIGWCCCCDNSEEEVNDQSQLVTTRRPEQRTYASCHTETPPILTPSLNIKLLNTFKNALHHNELLQNELGSQGFHSALDGTYAYSHESTIPRARFINKKLPCAVNMDRGGVVRRPDGSHASCIADGVSSAGCFSAVVAHMISLYFLHKFSAHRLSFTSSRQTNTEMAKAIFTECASIIGNSSPKSEKGSSTALFAECVPLESLYGKRLYNVHVMALGDCAAFHINTDTQTVTQLNAIHRKCTNEGKPDPTDCGGAIRSDGKIAFLENVETSVTEANEDDYIVLATDGLTDNVRDGNVIQTIQVVAFDAFFDQPTEILTAYDRPWEGYSISALPTIDQLVQFIVDNSKERLVSIVKPTAEQITKRLTAYVKLVTHYHCHLIDLIDQGLPKQLNYTISTTPKPDDCMIITFSPGTR